MNSKLFTGLLYLVYLNFTLSHWSGWHLIPLILFFPLWGDVANQIQVRRAEIKYKKSPEYKLIQKELEDENTNNTK